MTVRNKRKLGKSATYEHIEYILKNGRDAPLCPPSQPLPNIVGTKILTADDTIFFSMKRR